MIAKAIGWLCFALIGAAFAAMGMKVSQWSRGEQAMAQSKRPSVRRRSKRVPLWLAAAPACSDTPVKDRLIVPATGATPAEIRSLEEAYNRVNLTMFRRHPEYPEC